MFSDFTFILVHFIISLPLQIRPLIVLTFDATELSRPGLEGDLTHGEHFMACFQETLVKKIIKEPQKSILIIEEMLTPDINPRNLTILSSLFSSHFSITPFKRYISHCL